MSRVSPIDRQSAEADIANNERRLREARRRLIEARRLVDSVSKELTAQKELFVAMYGASEETPVEDEVHGYDDIHSV